MCDIGGVIYRCDIGGVIYRCDIGGVIYRCEVLPNPQSNFLFVLRFPV